MSKPKKIKLPDGVMFTIQGNKFTFKLNDGDKSIKFYDKIIKYFFKGKECVYKSERCYIISLEGNPDDTVFTFELNFPDRDTMIMEKLRKERFNNFQRSFLK
jgi:hypothetical protein